MFVINLKNGLNNFDLIQHRCRAVSGRTGRTGYFISFVVTFHAD